MPRGRPRQFDETEVLDTAMQLLQAHGFAGVSVADVCAATGTSPQSLYNAFGDKAGLVRRVMERFGVVANDPIIAALESAPDPLDALADFVRAWRRHIGAASGNCCLFTRALALADHLDGDEAEVARVYTKRLRAALRRRARDASDAGQLPGEADHDAVADALLTSAFGVAVMSRSGLPGTMIEHAARQGLRTLGLAR